MDGKQVVREAKLLIKVATSNPFSPSTAARAVGLDRTRLIGHSRSMVAYLQYTKQHIIINKFSSSHCLFQPLQRKVFSM